jgi:DNA-binding IclR family transcriptional regulator
VLGGRKFQLGTQALSLGHAYVAASPVMAAARPLMQALADRLNVSVALAVGDQLDMLYVAYCKSARTTTLHFGVGTVLPMASTSIGRAYVWALPVAERRQRLAALAAQAGTDGLEATGYCLSFGEYQRDAYGVAVPLRVGTQQTLMGLACGAAALGLDPARLREKIAPEVLQAAVGLGRALVDVDCTP